MPWWPRGTQWAGSRLRGLHLDEHGMMWLVVNGWAGRLVMERIDRSAETRAVVPKALETCLHASTENPHQLV